MAGHGVRGLRFRWAPLPPWRRASAGLAEIPALPLPRAWLAGVTRHSRARRVDWVLAIVLPDRCRLVRCRRPVHLRRHPWTALAVHLAPESEASAATTVFGQPVRSLTDVAARRTVAMTATRAVASPWRPASGGPIGTESLFRIPGPRTDRVPRFRVAMTQKRRACLLGGLVEYVARAEGRRPRLLACGGPSAGRR